MEVNSSFETEVFGKWILAGEHAVLRGCPALVFPLKSRSIRLSYKRQIPSESLELNLEGQFGEEYRLLFWGVLERAFQMKNIRRSDLAGSIRLSCSIPIGSGLGASASLCVAVTRWLVHFNYVSDAESLEFSRLLENLFHGESSGVDVAVALSGEPIRFVRNQERSQFRTAFRPNWSISFSGKRGVTADCVAKVKELLLREPKLGLQIDQDMFEASRLCEEALREHQEPRHALELLVKGIKLAKSCFDRWDLTEGALTQHMDMLEKHGALAVKPTGSGQGGYVLSLWAQQPPPELKAILIECS